MIIGRPTVEEKLRFWSKVDKTDECWIWQAGTFGREGYGAFWYRGRNVGAHQFSAYLEFEVVSSRLNHVHHLCLNKLCVNPAHLSAMPAKEHMLIGNSRPAKQARQTHCHKGHKFTKENTYNFRGSRICRTCHRERQREWLKSL